MKFRRFTPAGISAVRDFLAKTKAASSIDLAARDALLASPTLTESVPALADLDFDPERTFDTTFAFCEYLDSILASRNPQTYREDVGFWTYLSIAYVEQLAGKVGSKIKIGADPRLVYDATSHMTGHRHLLCFPFYLYNAYREQPDICKVILWHRPNVYNDLVEQLLSRQFVIQNPALLKAANDLYFDNQKATAKRGAAGGGKGSVRRFITMVDQFSMTRDFFELNDAEEFLKLLPKEFERFQEKS